VLRVYAHNSISPATEFVEDVHHRLPMAIQLIQTDPVSEFGTDFTCRISESFTGRVLAGALRPMERSSGAIGRTKTSSTGA
jgi:hypothetical protein